MVLSLDSVTNRELRSLSVSQHLPELRMGPSLFLGHMGCQRAGLTTVGRKEGKGEWVLGAHGAVATVP